MTLPGFCCADSRSPLRPVRRRDGRHEIGDARAVLRNAHAVFARDARITVRHVRRVLLVRDRNEADARERKQIVRVHVRTGKDHTIVRVRYCY